jgi:hypothetical protein
MDHLHGCPRGRGAEVAGVSKEPTVARQFRLPRRWAIRTLHAVLRLVVQRLLDLLDNRVIRRLRAVKVVD